MKNLFKKIYSKTNKYYNKNQKIEIKRNLILDKKFTLLLDVGANIGQYALQARKNGFSGKIISFEPLPDAHKYLTVNASSDPDWVVYERCAIGENDYETNINISINSYSSSILPILASHTSAAPDSVYVGTAKTKVKKLDSILEKMQLRGEKIFLKIDTQGYEDKVLAGIKEKLNYIDGFQIEISLVDLYEGQKNHIYFFEFFEKNNFYIWSIIPGFSDPKTGQCLQFDAVFIRKNLIHNELNFHI